MQAIEKTIATARRRLNWNRFLRLLFISLALGMGAAAVAWIAPKIWPAESWFPGDGAGWWYRSSLLGGLGLAVLTAVVLMWRRRTSQLDAAVEVDRRFGLRERLSSALALDPQSAESPVGQALLADAESRASRIDVRDQFPIRMDRTAGWVLLPLAAIGLLSLIPDARSPEPVPVTQVVNNSKPIELAVAVARKSLEEKAKQLEEKGLKDAAADLESLARKLDSLPSGQADLKKETLIKLNDVKDQIDKQRSSLGDVESLKQNLSKLKEAGPGPAEKLNQALAEGDFEKARELVKDLARKLKEGQLSERERKQLADQLQKMAEAADKLVKEQEQAKRDLEEQIRQAQAEGNLEKATELQKKLEQRQARERQLEQLKKAAENLQKASEAIQPRPSQGQQPAGDKASGKPNKQSKSEDQQQGQADDEQASSEGAGQSAEPSEQQMQSAQRALEDLADQMEQLEKDSEMQEQLEDLEQGLQECKDEINGCPNPGERSSPSKKPSKDDFAKGDGRGHGARDLEQGEAGNYQSKVKGNIQKGETVISGNADGQNLPGSSAAEARELIKSELNRQSDPLEDQQLPRSQREQAKEYFEKLRGGGSR